MSDEFTDILEPVAIPARRASVRVRLNYYVVAYMCLIHSVAIYALFLNIRLSYIPLAIATYLMVGFSTTIGLHRLLSHRSFQCAKWFEYLLVTAAMLTAQGSPLIWVANHRMHHSNSDQEEDVHSPRRGFWYSHFGWIIDDGSTDRLGYRKFCKDLMRDPYYHWLLRYRLAPQLLAVLLIGLLLGWSAVPLVFFLPVVCWMHSTYAVNSFCHHKWFGSRMFNTKDESRNVWWVGVLALGEGWHNNHHADPCSVRHGVRWKQVDLSYLLIRLLSRMGLVWSLKEPERAEESREKTVLRFATGREKELS
jgi:stearoyl-CoA desaturase (delta-9 desaturase)